MTATGTPWNGESEADLLVVCRGHGHHAVVQAVRQKGLDVRLHRTATAHAVDVTARVGDGDELDTGQAGQDPGVVAPHHPEADQARTQVRHDSGPCRREGVDRRDDALEVPLAQ